MVGELGGEGAGGDEVRAGEGGEEVVEGVFVGEVDDGDGGGEGAFVVGFTAEEVVLSKRQVEEAARGDARRVVVVVLRVDGGNGDK